MLKIKQGWRQFYSKSCLLGLQSGIPVLSCPFICSSSASSLTPIFVTSFFFLIQHRSQCFKTSSFSPLSYVLINISQLKVRSEISHLRVHSAVVSVRFSTAYICAAILERKTNRRCRHQGAKKLNRKNMLSHNNIYSQFLFFPPVSTFLPLNTPTNLVLQLYSLGTGPKIIKRRSG